MTPLEQAQAASRAAVYRARLANRRREIAAAEAEHAAKFDRVVEAVRDFRRLVERWAASRA